METINELSFEQAFDQLEEVIARLESGELSLEESVTLYEQGKQLSARCQQLLDDAELRVKKIADDGSITGHSL
ncbi:MAG: exodeoxyribonuclease VII small subunit [Anaerolineae bacterium]|nr:exodeoxyribonuclease VII small subunit [Anaerolineae bacterium]